jgi:predicted AAA+ superfamily ATPase
MKEGLIFLPLDGKFFTMNKRNISYPLLEALADTPVIFLRGARQTGKTTLVRILSEDEGNARNYVTLDSATALAASLQDPVGFLRELDKPLTLDEVQRAPGLMLAIKEDVDCARFPGRYLLTGSANVFAMPKVADSLAGRMEIFTLYPLSQGEIGGIKEDFISHLFSQQIFLANARAEYSTKNLFSAMCDGGYPEVLSRNTEKRRGAWFDSYITTLIERDVRDISNVQDRSGIIRLLSILATRSATLFNQSEISRMSGIPNSTLVRYIALLEALFLIYFLPAWSSNLGKKLVRSPKIHVVDSGLAAHLCGANVERLKQDPTLAGRLLESFVVGEIVKQSSWSEHLVNLYHYRSQTGDEIDLLLEDRTGNIVAIEVKLSHTISRHDVKSMMVLRDSLGERFIRGMVIYSGSDVLPLGDRLFASPVRMLFQA